MSEIRGWATLGAKQKLVTFSYDLGPLGPEEVVVAVDYCGFKVQEGFLVGYGLDYAEQYRYLPDICVIEE